MIQKYLENIHHPMKYMPINACIVYLLVTMSIAFWGPIKYFQFPIGKTAIFMISVIISIYLGFWAGARSKYSIFTETDKKSERFFENLFKISIAISILSLIISIFQAIISGTLNTDVSSMGEAYISGYDYVADRGRNSGSYSLYFIIYTLAYPFSFITFTMGLFYIRSLSGWGKAIFFSYVAMYMLFYVIGSGKMKYLGDLIIYSLSVLAVRHGLRGKPLGWRMIISSALALIIGILALLAVLGQRYAALGVTASNANVRANVLMYFDLTHPIFKIFGENLGLNLAMLLSYVSQGYYGLGLSLETDWEWTRFQGFSYSISVLCNQILGLDWAWPHALVSQVGWQWGWGETKWHTVFPHFATDFTFPGTVILFGFFAYIYARSWVKAINFDNPAAMMMFVMLSVGMFFMPANNQLLQTPGALLLVLTISAIYLRFGDSFNSKNLNSEAIPAKADVRHAMA